MKRAKGEDGSKSNIDRISELPQGILQQILYFLSQQEAVRTSVLSKSWRYIWCTRPNLDFSYITFKGTKRKFISVVNNTLQLYCDQKLCLEEFGLCISLDEIDDESVWLLGKWIPMLTTMGVKEFRFSICYDSEGCIFLPSVVLETKSLKDLHVEGFILDQEAIERILPFNHLKKLHLKYVEIDDEILEKIISCCPLIETLRVLECERRLTRIKLNELPNLKHFSFSYNELDERDWEEALCSIEIQHPQSLETIEISDGDIWFQKGTDFRNLRDLSLCGVRSSLGHLSSCKFPRLERLTFSVCEGLEEIELFIDAPNMVYFQYEGSFIPSISFATNTSSSGEWRSNLGLTYMPIDDGSLWFLKVNELLKSLSQSTILLSIDQYYMDDKDIVQENMNLVQNNGCDIAVVVESLSLRGRSSAVSSYLNVVFAICRPRILRHEDMEVIERLWKILVQREYGDKDDQFGKLWKRDLEEASLEIKEMDREEEWRTITLSELQSCEQKGKGHIATRFALKWRQTL